MAWSLLLSLSLCTVGADSAVKRFPRWERLWFCVLALARDGGAVPPVQLRKHDKATSEI